MESVIVFFRTAFTLVLALALSEAFKQFVTDRIAGSGDYQEPASNFRIILWPRFPALWSFLLFYLAIFSRYESVLL